MCTDLVAHCRTKEGKENFLRNKHEEVSELEEIVRDAFDEFEEAARAGLTRRQNTSPIP